MKRSAEAELAEADAEKRKRRSEMNKELRELDETGATDRLQELCDKWQLGEEGRSKSFEDQIMRMFRLFDLDYRDNMLASLDVDRGSFGLRELDDRINECELEAFGLYHRLRELRLLPETKEDTSPEKQLALRRIQKVLEMTFHARRLVLSAFQARLAVHQLHLDEGTLDLAPDLDVRLGSWALRFRYIDGKTNNMQNLLLYLLDGAMEKRYRKSNGWMYEPIHLGGQSVHAWRPVKEIKDFVYSMLPKETHWEQWCNATQSGTKNISSAIEYLTNCQDYQLPELRKMRAVYSFRNGVYLAGEGRFHRFGARDGRPPLGEDVVACKFIDQDFEEFDGVPWRDIPTPYLHSIMTYQGFSPEVCDWLYILLGRLLYPLNQHDSWQVIPFVKGVGSTGKCFAAGTEVLMHDGRRLAVERVRVGDEVMGDDGTPRRVLGLARGDSRMYAIAPRDGSREPLVVTPEHVLCLVRARDDPPTGSHDPTTTRAPGPMTMTVEEFLALPPDQREGLQCYRAGYVRFPGRAAPPVDPRHLGAWFATGTTPADGSGTGGSIHAFQTGMRAVGLLAPDRDLSEYDLLDERVFAAHVPECIMFGSAHVRLEFVMGLIDAGAEGPMVRPGDEDRPPSETWSVRVRAARSSIRLLRDIAFVVRSTGLAARVQPDTSICIDRSEHGQHSAWEGCRAWAFDVRPEPRQAYYGFETDGNHRFLLDDFTVTHNSTILLKVAKNFYDAMDVGVLSNNVERKFGLSAFYNKLLFVAPEVKADLCLEQAELQSVISGEDLQINVKHKVAFSKTWDTPGMLAGNEVPSWVDNGGSVQRRVIVFEFAKAVVDGDMKLGEKLEAELPRILLKCNTAYRATAERHSHVNVWTILPKYFHATRDTLAQSVNSVEAFLASGEVIKDESVYCPMEDFRAALKTFEMRNNYKSKKYDDDFFMGPFGKAGIRIEKRVKKPYRGQNRTRDYVMGVDLDMDTEDNDLG